MKRVLFFIVVLLSGLGWYAQSQFETLWNRRHELVAARIRDRLTEIAPEWRIDFSSAELLDGARIRLTDIVVGPRERGDVIIEVPELELQLNPELFAHNLQVLITDAEVREAVLHVQRDHRGVWNVQDLPPCPGSDKPTPNIHFLDGAVRVRLEADEFLPATEFDLTAIDMSLVNSAFRQFDITGRSTVDAAGALEFEGTLDLDTHDWSLSGRCSELRSPDGLLRLAASLSPEARQRMETLASHCVVQQIPPHRPLGQDADGTIRAVNHAGREGDLRQRCAIPDLGVSAEVEVAFNLVGGDAERPLEYQLGARIQRGVIDNPALPLPLHDLQGELFVDNAQVILRSFQASNGESRLYVDGHIRRDAAAGHKRFVLQAENLRFGREIQSQLWGGFRRFYDSMQPAGRFNVDLIAETNAAGDWDVTLNQFEASDCSVLLAAFPYPTSGITGRIWQEGERFLIEGTGLAGRRPFTARGEFRNPGPHLTSDINIQVDAAPIDEHLLHALTTPRLLPARTALENLRLTGLVDVNARVVKRGVPGEPPRVALDARLHDGAANFVHFPYPITRISGRLTHNPLAADPALHRIWQFTELQGRHGPAQISGSGGLAAQGGASVLDMTVTSLDTPLDRDLEQACLTASHALRELWDSIGRVGRADLENIRVVWSPRSPPVVSLPSILVSDAQVRLKYWPYPWERVTGKLAWDNNRLTIASLTGWYGGETYLQIDNGGEPTAAVLDIHDRGDLEWQLHLEDVRIRKLIPDSNFRRSLIPSGVHTVVDELDPRGPIDLDIGLDVKGHRSQPGLVTAAWHLDAALANNALSAGVDLTDVAGVVKVVRGAWNGRESFVEGYFDLESATALDIPLTSITGPFLVDGNDVYVGTPAWPGVQTAPPYDAQANPYAAKEAQADVYGGRLGCNLQARLDPLDPEQTTYRGALTLRDARLEEWAVDNGYTTDRLYGPVNGQIDFIGRGTSDRAVRGQGWVQVSPAHLYELPVLNRVLASFDLRQPNRTAFNYAYGEFTLHDGLFDFSLIDLVGQALRLVGRGTVAYAEGLDNRLAIDFYRSKFRNQIPVWGQLFSMVTTNSIGVRVGGTVSNPVVNVQPKLGIVDDTLRKLLDAFNSGQTPSAPRPIPLRGQPLRKSTPRR